MKSVLLYIDDNLYNKLKVFSKNEELSIVTAINRIIAEKIDMKDALDSTIGATRD